MSHISEHCTAYSPAHEPEWLIGNTTKQVILLMIIIVPTFQMETLRLRLHE